MEQKQRKLPVLLRILIVLTAAFMALSIICVITVNWLDLKSREENTAPELFGWYFAALPANLTKEQLYAGDLLLAKKAQSYAEGTLVLCRNVPGGDIMADGRFVLARVDSQIKTEYALDVCLNSGEFSTVLDQDDIVGQVSYAVGFWGAATDFVRKPVGFFSLILGSAGLLLILILVSAVITYRRNMRELYQVDAAEQTTIENFELEQPKSLLLNREVEITPEQVALAEEDSSEKVEKEDTSPASADKPDAPVPLIAEKPEAAQKPVIRPATASRPEPAAVKPAQPVQKPVSAGQASQKTIPPSATELPHVEKKPVQPAIFSNTSVGKPANLGDKLSFSDLSTDEIIEQFRRELEAVRLRPLEPEDKEHRS